MTENGGYDLKPDETPPAPAPPTDGAAAGTRPKPGEPGWVEPVPIIEKADPEPEVTPEERAAAEEVADVEKHKGMALLGYIFFIIPLVAAPNSKFARYHANQGLLVFITLFVACVGVTVLWVLSHLIGMFIKIDLLLWFFSCGLGLLQFLLLAGWVGLVIAGIIHAANGEKKPLPIVGHWTLIK